MFRTNDTAIEDFDRLTKQWQEHPAPMVFVAHRSPSESELAGLFQSVDTRLLLIHPQFSSVEDASELRKQLPADLQSSIFGLAKGWDLLRRTEREEIVAFLHAMDSGGSPAVHALLALGESERPLVLRIAMECASDWLSQDRTQGTLRVDIQSLVRPIAALAESRSELTAIGEQLDAKGGWAELESHLAETDLPPPARRDLSNEEFDRWVRVRRELKHGWFDKLLLICRTNESDVLPDSFEAWDEKIEKMKAWLRTTARSLSPARYLACPVFDCWRPDLASVFEQRIDQLFCERTRIQNQNQPVLDKIEMLSGQIRELGPRKSGNAAKIRNLAVVLQEIQDYLYALPRGVHWPEETKENQLPLVLIVDDELGRITPSAHYAASLDSGTKKHLEDWRRSICKRLALRDVENPNTDAQVPEPVALVHFRAGQRYRKDKGYFENDLTSVSKLLRQSEASSRYALVLVDVRFNAGPPDRAPSDFGIDHVAPTLKKEFPELPIVMFTAERSDEVVNRIRLQLNLDYLDKASTTEVQLLHQLQKSGRVTADQWRAILRLPANLVARDPATMSALFEAWHAARDPLRVNLLLSGPSGVGKTTVARWIHQRSPRAAGPFEKVECGTLAPALADGELFGSYRGSYTGASENRRGLFHRAHEGTLFLDEIADLPSEVQNKLKGALEGDSTVRMFRALGPGPPGDTSLDGNVDVRVITATNKDLSQFDEALRARLGFAIRIPDLHERREDIVPIALYYLGDKFKLDKPRLRFAQSAEQRLIRLFTEDGNRLGNIRGLSDLMYQVGRVKTDGDLITVEDLDAALPRIQTQEPSRSLVHSIAVPKRAAPPLNDLDAALNLVFQWLSHGRSWDDLTQAEIRSIDDALDKKFVVLVTELFAWYIHRYGGSLADAYRHLTGAEPDARIPQDFIRRVLRLDPEGIGKRLETLDSAKSDSPLGKLIGDIKSDKRRIAKPPRRR